jgi:hypothetical protein
VTLNTVDSSHSSGCGGGHWTATVQSVMGALDSHSSECGGGIDFPCVHPMLPPPPTTITTAAPTTTTATATAAATSSSNTHHHQQKQQVIWTFCCNSCT